MSSEMGIMKIYYMESFDGEKLYTEVFLPDDKGKYPIICIRNPYVTPQTNTPEEIEKKIEEQCFRLKEGFGVVHQHCRGYGENHGRAIPFVYEKRDGLKLLDWIQQQEWYEGGIYLEGASYTAYVHLSMLDEVPEAVKTASLGVYASHYYPCVMLNGEFKMRIWPLWYPTMLRNETQLANLENSYDVKNIQKFYHAALIQYPFYKFPERLFGHDIPEMTEGILSNGDNDEYSTRKNGPGDAHDVMKHIKIPVLLKGGWFEPFFNGMVTMWDEIPEDIRRKSAFLVGPWTHGTSLKYVEKCPFFMENGEIEENTHLAWFLHIRDGKPFKFAQEGKLSTYIVGEAHWENCDQFQPDNTHPMRLYPAEDAKLLWTPPEQTELSYKYNPHDPPEFVGGQNAFSTLSDGAALQPEPNFRPDVKSFLTEPLTNKLSFRGSTKIHFVVKSDCYDTAFLARICAITESGEAWVLQETISTLTHAVGAYDPNTYVEFDLVTDPLHWTLKPGERIRVDIASANAFSYWPHSNTRGFWAVQSQTCIATNTLVLGKLYLEFPAIETVEVE